MQVQLVGPQAAKAVLKIAQIEGALGRGHKNMDRAVARLIANDGFELKGKTRAKKFTNTFKAFSTGGACAGAALGTGIMAVPDLITGRGRIRKEFERSHFIDTGVLGNMGYGITALSSTVVEGVCAGTGALMAFNPASAASKKSFPQVLKSYAKGGQKVGGQSTALVLGAGIGLGLSAIRLPSLIFKYALAGIIAIPSAVVGFLGGSIRAIINK